MGRLMSSVSLALLAVVVLVGCAGRSMHGASSDVAWRVEGLQTSERTAVAPAYHREGQRRVYRYVVVLEETGGVGVKFNEMQSIVMMGPGFRPNPRTVPVNVTLPARGQARVPMADSAWTVVPQWFEGVQRPVNLDPVARKVLTGTNDRGEKVEVVMEFALEHIPPR